MRTLAVQTFLSLDGVMQGPGGPTEDPSNGFDLGGWLVPYADQDMGEQVTDWMLRAEDFLLGRGTYEIFHAHWPHVPVDDDPVARAINERTKHVASRTLTSLEWDTARLIRGDVVDAVRALKDRDGGELQVHGSAGLVRTLLQNDLVDELRLIVFPVLVGSGKRLFTDGVLPSALRLGSATTTSTGAVILDYHRAGEITAGTFALDPALAPSS